MLKSRETDFYGPCCKGEMQTCEVCHVFWLEQRKDYYGNKIGKWTSGPDLGTERK